MAAKLPVLGLMTHKQRVVKLYKGALKTLQDIHHERPHYHYEAALMRARFDRHKNEPDMRKAHKLLLEGEEELFKESHIFPFKYATSPGGSAYGIVVLSPDHILDLWHPLEKAAFPQYFKTREIRKKEYVAWWEQQYGKPTADSTGGHH